MTLADAIAAEPPRRPGYACGVKTLLESLDDADRATLTTALTGSIQTSLLHRALKSEGHTVNEQALGRHRRGDCSCLSTTR